VQVHNVDPSLSTFWMRLDAFREKNKLQQFRIQTKISPRSKCLSISSVNAFVMFTKSENSSRQRCHAAYFSFLLPREMLPFDGFHCHFLGREVPHWVPDRPRRKLSMHIHTFCGDGSPISASMFHNRGRGVVAEPQLRLREVAQSLRWTLLCDRCWILACEPSSGAS
jgi:hypothetical protein